MGHALGLATQGRLNDLVSRRLIVLRFTPSSGGNLPDLPDALIATRFRHNCTVGRLTPSCSAMATLSWPARAPKIIRQRSATCCGVPYEDSIFPAASVQAGSNWIARLVFGMSEIIAIAVKSVNLFKGHYTSC